MKKLHYVTHRDCGVTACGKSRKQRQWAASIGRWDASIRFGRDACPECASHVDRIRPRAHGGS